MNFLEAVFSFVFGDGDPNANFDRRWGLLGADYMPSTHRLCPSTESSEAC